MSKKSRISLLIMALLIVGSAVAVADPLEKLPRDIRLRFLESLTINGNGRPASAWIGGVKSRLSTTEWQDFKAMLGWGQLEDDHVGYSCYKAGDCAKVTDHICDPSKCTGLTFTLGSKLRVVSVAERAEFLLALRFDRGRATNLPLNRIRRHLKPADIADLEKMAR